MTTPISDMYVDLLDSFIDRLDDLLHRIAAKLQLTETQYATAESRYTIIAELLAENSSLAALRPTIYSQGSFRIGTSVKPTGRDEFDVDLVVEFDVAARYCHTPRSILDEFEAVLKSNGRYSDMVERMNRCIRLNYAGEFHMDILPAFASRIGNSDCIEVPDEDLQCWLPSNPKGYANWFERKALIFPERSYKAIENLPSLEDVDRKPPLKRSVQLLKRARNLAYAHPEGSNIASPGSIILTTLAGNYYNDSASVSLALAEILNRIVAEIDRNPQSVLEVRNPVIEGEIFSEDWASNPHSFISFVAWIRQFQKDWVSLISMDGAGMESVAAKLKVLFGEVVSISAIDEQMEYINRLGIRRETTSGSLTTATKSAAASIPDHTFFGRRW